MMDIRRTHSVLFAAAFLLAGCRNGQSAAAPSVSPPHSGLPTLARVHWLGMKRLAGETNAASVMAIWDLPESRKLEQQTLNKLSLAPWRLLHRPLDTNAAPLLLPLLGDVVSNESCLEIRGATNQPDELAFAIRLSARRAALWQTNLARVLKSLTGISPVPAPDHGYGWSLKKHHAPDLIELTRAGGWTILGAAQDQNRLAVQLKSRIQHGQAPVTAGGSNDWLAADLNPARLIPALATLNSHLATFNRFFLSVAGGGSNVLTHARAGFSRPLGLDLPPWTPPASLIDERVASFTAIRGFRPWLKSLKAWNELQIGPLPDQIYFWALQGSKTHSYFAAPLPDASNEVTRLTGRVLQKESAWFATNGLAKFERSKKFNGLQWKGLPFMWPFLRSITVGRQNFVYAGGFPDAKVYPISRAWLHGALGRTNLVCYDTEATGQRVEQWIYMGQFARFVARRAQLPFHSPAMLWLKAIAPKLHYSVTHVTETGPNRLAFSRRSTIGFTAIELNLLADWLESPQFPVGLHTFLAKPGEAK